MTKLKPEQFAAIVDQANLAPSVHNTQPTRWQLNDDGSVRMFLDERRILAVGDPERRDASVSLGNALYATDLALSAHGLAIAGQEQTMMNGLPEVHLEIGTSDETDNLHPIMSQRLTWRGGFAGVSDETLSALHNLGVNNEDSNPIVARGDIEWLAEMNDAASLDFFRHTSYRTELLDWMRLSHRHDNWNRDGLNSDALGMSGIEAFGAGIVLRPPVFELCDRLGAATGLISERRKTLSSCGVVLFHRPADEDPVMNGMAFYRVLLQLARLGLAAWPMAVLADSVPHRQEVARRFGLGDDRRLINAFRVGRLPPGAKPKRVRLPASELFTIA